MKRKSIIGLLVMGFLSVSFTSISQCEIKNRINPDDSMLYYIEPVNFYWTASKDLKGGVVTDRENYFLALQPNPYPEKEKGEKLKDDLEMKLSNDSAYILKHYDTRYLEHDSVIQLLYLINRDDIDAFLNYDAVSAQINMGDEEGLRRYTFKLHKSAIKEQLACFLNEAEENKKKK